MRRSPSSTVGTGSPPVSRRAGCRDDRLGAPASRTSAGIGGASGRFAQDRIRICDVKAAPGAVADQQFGSFPVTLLYRKHQRRPAILIRIIDSGAACEKGLGRSEVRVEWYVYPPPPGRTDPSSMRRNRRDRP